MELIDIVDENGIPTGETIDRTDAHRTGTRHRTTHIWIVRRREDKVQILLQKRAKYIIIVDGPKHGEVSEWSNVHAWKACIRKRIGGSNPLLSAKIWAFAHFTRCFR